MGSRKFYISKLKRDLAFGSKSISPDFYDTRKSIKNDVITRVLRNSPNLFNNGIPRIPNYEQSETPGPGFYNTNVPSFKVETIPPECLNELKDY